MTAEYAPMMVKKFQGYIDRTDSGIWIPGIEAAQWFERLVNDNEPNLDEVNELVKHVKYLAKTYDWHVYQDLRVFVSRWHSGLSGQAPPPLK
jgi:hypothetical protein